MIKKLNNKDYKDIFGLPGRFCYFVLNMHFSQQQKEVLKFTPWNHKYLTESQKPIIKYSNFTMHLSTEM